MTSVQIVTDSLRDLPEEVIAELNIKIVPLKIRFGETESVDRFELSTDQFWDKCQSMDEPFQPGAFVELRSFRCTWCLIEAAQQAALMVKTS